MATARFIKHTPSGQVFVYAEPWIDNADFEECANPAGDPMPEEAPVVNAPPARKKRGAEIEVPVADAALQADASRGLVAQGL